MRGSALLRHFQKRDFSQALFQSLEARQLLSASSLDTSFHGTGSLSQGFGTNAAFTSVVTMPDGKVLAAGTFLNGAHKNDFVVARYNSNGSIDTTFGGGTGRVFTDFSSRDDHATQLVLVGGGKFVVVGRSAASDETTAAGRATLDFAIARYNASGTLDTSFNSTGRKTIDFVGRADYAAAAAVLTTGQLLVVGTCDSGGHQETDFAAVRLNVNGSLDTSFGTSGKLRSDISLPAFNFDSDVPLGFNFGDSFGTCVTVLPSGGFFIGGQISDIYSEDDIYDFALAKYTSSGKLDTSFGGGDGWMQTGLSDVSTQACLCTSIALLADGKVLLAGGDFDAFFQIEFSLFLTRINSNGTVDTSFGPAGSNGKVVTDLNGTTSDPADFSRQQIDGMIVQPNGKILTTGGYRDNQMFLARYTSNGVLDTSFSGDGKAFYSNLSGAHAISSSPGGKTVVAGFAGKKAAIARFGADSAATASISGTFFNDLDGDGFKDANEHPLVGWQAFVDSNNDGFYTPGETIATTNSSGKYTISGLVSGKYRIREVRLTGWNRTKPAGVYPLGYYDVALLVGQTVVGKDFGNKHV